MKRLEGLVENEHVKLQLIAIVSQSGGPISANDTRIPSLKRTQPVLASSRQRRIKRVLLVSRV